MSVMAVLIALVAVYFSVLAAMIICQERFNQKITIAVFTTVNVMLFIGQWLYNYYQREQFVFFLLDQISPCMFTLLSLACFMKRGIKNALYRAAAFLSCGMLLAMLLSPGAAYIEGYVDDRLMLFTLDILQHLNFSLFGMFLVLSGRVRVNFKSLTSAMGFLFSIIGFVLLVNFVFRQNFFGMGYYGEYGIYRVKLFDSYWLTLATYLFGVFLVLIIGYGFSCILLKLTKREDEAPVITDIRYADIEEFT